MTLLATGGGGWPGPAHAFEQRLLFLPFVQARALSGGERPGETDRHELRPAFDLVYAYDGSRLRVLGEAFIDEQEQELERFQLGLPLGPGNDLWLGRFHNPLGYWNSAFHHGLHLQLTVSRPRIWEYEDEGGPLPTHLAGLLLEGERYRNGTGWTWKLALGVGPELDADAGTLESLDVLSPGSGRHGPAAVLRLALRREERPLREIGLAAGVTRIARADKGPDIDQYQLAGYLKAGYRGLELLSELAGIVNRQDGRRHGFLSGYVQLGWRAGTRYQLYGRAEDTWGDASDPYLTAFPLHVRRAQSLGARVDLTVRQALSFEYRHNEDGRLDYSEWVLQWSGMFP